VGGKEDFCVLCFVFIPFYTTNTNTHESITYDISVGGLVGKYENYLREKLECAINALMIS
jgi:hypothetical protein